MSVRHRITPARSIAGLLLPLLLFTAAPTLAQRAAGGGLTLEEAVRLARRHNPEFLMQKNNGAAAEWGVREAWAAFLPSANVGASMQYQAPGSPRFGVFTGADIGVRQTPPYYFSGYRLGVSYQLNKAMFARLSREKAERRATAARTRAAGHQLETDVTLRYLGVLRARDAVALARAELERAEENLELARARAEVGAAIALTAKQAAVERGRKQVALLKAENRLRNRKRALAQLLGREPDPDVRLTTDFEVFRPAWSQDALVRGALEDHPRLRALRAARNASEAASDAARAAYFPTLQLSAGWSGYTRSVGDEGYLIEQARGRAERSVAQCEATNALRARLSPPLPPLDCSALAFGPEARSSALARNDAFPFDFTPQPFSIRLQLSLPIFQGLTRERRIANAEVAVDDARERLRAQKLALETEIANALDALETAYRSVQLERRNKRLAAEQLRLARERYRVGAIRYLKLQEAETLKARADRAYLAAVYTFHEALARLEAAVGEELHTTDRSQGKDDS